MLISYTNSKIIRKIITSSTGEFFQVLFLLTLENNGEIKAKILSAVPINRKCEIEDPETISHSKIRTLCLPVYRVEKKPDTEYVSDLIPIVSPYSELYFLISQPTRAPSL